MPIDPYFVRRFPLVDGIGSWDEGETDPDKAARIAAYLRQQAYELPDGVRVMPVEVDGPRGPIPARLYRGRDDPRGALPAAGLLWLHGGGFTTGSLDSPEAHTVAAEVARRTGAVVLSVGYRLAGGGVHHPVPLDDVAAAWDWFARSAADLGVDPARVCIGGASAGAALAAGACVRLRDGGHELPARMLLAYPVLHFPTPALPDDVVLELRDVPPFHRFGVQKWTSIVRTYVGRTTDLPHEVLPGHADLTGLPPALVVVAEHDDLRPSGELFARQLGESGVAARTYLARGMLHGHLNREPTGELPEVDSTIDVLAQALR